MPGGDRTGPMGAGPMSGRGAGYCAGFNQPGYMSPGFRGRGAGFGGGGGGRGRRNRLWATGMPGWMRFGGGLQAPPVKASGDAERDLLLRQSEILQQQLDVLQQRLEALASTPDAVKP